MLAFLKQYVSRSEKAFMVLFLMALCQDTILSYPIAILNRIGGVGGDVLLITIYSILTIMVLPNKEITRYIRGADIMLIMFFAFYVIGSFFTTSSVFQTLAISRSLVKDILPCLPFFLLALCLKIDNISMDTIGKWNCLAVVLTSFYRIIYQNTEEWEVEYNMGAAYSLLVNLLIVIVYSFTTEKKIIPIICSVIGAFYMIAMGTRGPVFVMIALLLICVFLYTKINLFWKIILAIILSIVAVSYSSFELFGSMGWLGDLLSSMGLSTRVIDMGVEGDIISYTSGRDVIFDLLLSHIDELPFFGFGVLGESRFGILYAHNLYLQIIFNYGFLFGILIILFLVIISLNALFKTRGKLSQRWIIIWVVYVYVQGFVGGNMLSIEVFVLIGSCLRVLRMKKNEIQ